MNRGLFSVWNRVRVIHYLVDLRPTECVVYASSPVHQSQSMLTDDQAELRVDAVAPLGQGEEAILDETFVTKDWQAYEGREF